jgi:3-oxoacyl-[acyl-carrier-protein] synthase III
MSQNAVYIVQTSVFLPNDPVDNDAMENILGQVGHRPSRAKRTVLRSNGIKSRHYVIDPITKEPNFTNAQITANAVRGLFGQTPESLECLVCGTSFPDQLIPNHAVMVHGELGFPIHDVIATAGVCLSGATALKCAWLMVKSGEVKQAVSTGSEVSSLNLRASQFEAETEHQLEALEKELSIAFEKDFLRWMLSDGAGAVLLENAPRKGQLNLNIKWIEMGSYAHELPACMYAGAEQQEDGSLKGRFLYSAEALAEKSVLSIKQDVRLLDANIIKKTVDPLNRIRQKHQFTADQVDYFLPHYSSNYFRKPLADGLDAIDFHIPDEKWFTNLTSKGNTGAASPYIMLDELYHSDQLKDKDKILMYIPESGRFSSAYVLLEVEAH